MSRAFVKEDGPDTVPLPDLPISPHPNWVMPEGLADLRARLATRQEDLAGLKARTDRLDRPPEAAAERDIRYLEARLATAILVTPPDEPKEVAFGTRVTVEDETGRLRTYRIVGENEADPVAGLIAPQAPLARILIGLRVDEEVDWRGGALKVVSISL